MHKDIRSSVSISESKQRANRYHNAHKSIGFFGEEAYASKTAQIQQKASRSLFNENVGSQGLIDDMDEKRLQPQLQRERSHKV